MQERVTDIQPHRGPAGSCRLSHSLIEAPRRGKPGRAGSTQDSALPSKNSTDAVEAFNSGRNPFKTKNLCGFLGPSPVVLC